MYKTELKLLMPTSGGAYIPIIASREEIFREIKQLMGNGGRQAAFLIAHKAEQSQMSITGLILTPDAFYGTTEMGYTTSIFNYLNFQLGF